MKKGLLLIISIVLFFSSYSQPKKVHLINILDKWTSYDDPNDPTLERGYEMRATSNLLGSEMYSLCSNVAKKVTNGDFIEYKIYDDGDAINDPTKSKYSKYEILKLLETIECKGDIVIIVYSGHGFSSYLNKPTIIGKDSIFYPNMILNYASDVKESMPFIDILTKIQEKEPLLMFSVVNTCQELIANDVADFSNLSYESYKFDGYVRTFDFSTASVLDTESSLTNYEIANNNVVDLFKCTNYKSKISDTYKTISVELISCKKGEYTYIDSKGGHMVNSFIQTIDNYFNSTELATKSLTWEQFAYDVKTKTNNAISDYNVYAEKNKQEIQNQNAQCFVLLRSSKTTNIPKILKTGVVEEEPTKTPVVTTTNTDVATTNLFEYKPYKNVSYSLALRLVKLSNSYREAKCYTCATDALDAALPVLKKNNDKYFEAACYETYGYIYNDQGKTEDAKKQFENAIKIYMEINCCGSATTLLKKLKTDFKITYTDAQLKTMLGDCYDEWIKYKL